MAVTNVSVRSIMAIVLRIVMIVDVLEPVR